MLEEPRRLRAYDLPRPAIGDDAGLLRVEACGLCGTDHEQYSGILRGGFAFVPGHEVVGVVEAVGPAAAGRWDVAVGDRVAVEVFQSCGACAPCVAGEYRHCRRHGIGDMYGFIPVDKPPGLWGGYADHQYLAPDSRVLRVPAALDPVIATAFNPLGAGIRWGVTVPGTSEGDVVAVLGPGIRGLSAVAAVHEAGAGFVLSPVMARAIASGSRSGTRSAPTSPSTARSTTPLPRSKPPPVVSPTSSSTSPPRRPPRWPRRWRWPVRAAPSWWRARAARPTRPASGPT